MSNRINLGRRIWYACVSRMPLRVQTLAIVSGLILLAFGTSGASIRTHEDFSSDPFAPDTLSAWQHFGNPELFAWDSSREAVSVTWDSSQPNSYLYHPLPLTLHRQHNFQFGFTLELDQHDVGVHPEKPGTFQITIGLIDTASALSSDYLRAVPLRTTNLVEWTWFGADPSISPSVSPVIVPQDGRFPWGYGDSFFQLELGRRYSFDLNFDAANQQLTLGVEIDGEPGPALVPVVLPSAFTDFQVNAFSIHSYSGEGQDTRFAGSVLAHGWVHDVYWEIPDTVEPPNPTLSFVGNAFQRAVDLETLSGWWYGLEGSHDLVEWEPLNSEVEGNGKIQRLMDHRRAVFPQQYYRVHIRRP